MKIIKVLIAIITNKHNWYEFKLPKDRDFI